MQNQQTWQNIDHSPYRMKKIYLFSEYFCCTMYYGFARI